jgi:glutamyl-tRNA synthetase
VIRFRTPLEGETVIEDLVRGQVVFEHRLLGDTVLMRGGGRPTYQLANPLDDLAMGITHVIRGEDLLSSTPRQKLLVEALGGSFPQTAHLSMILGADKKRLSKRHGAASVEEFREAGYLPEALVNFLALCGWSWDGETELMSVAELIERFSLERVNPAPAVFDHEKLAWMNGQHLRALDVAAYTAALRRYLEDAGSPLAGAARLDELVPVVQEKLGAFGEFDALVGSLLESREPDPESWQKLLNDEHAARIIDAAITSLSALSAWTVENVESALRAVCEELEMKPRQAFLPIRVASAGSTVAAGLYESIAFLGSEASLARLQHARAALTNV